MNTGGAAGGEPACDQAGDEEQDWHKRESPRIVGGDAPKLSGDDFSQGEAYEQAEDYSDGDEAEAHANNHLQNVGTFRAEGHANTDLLSALRGGVGEHAVNADGYQNQADRSEDHH